MTYIIENNRHLRIEEAQLEPTPRRAPQQGDTSALRVWATATQRHGIWQMEAGTLPDVQGPETVVIVSGSASVTVQPENVTYKLLPGDVFTFDAGETATWVVSEHVRKFFVTNPGMNPNSGA